MVKIYVIDNGGQWTHREWRVLKYLDVETKIVPNTVTFNEISYVDGLVLSGGAPRVGVESELGSPIHGRLGPPDPAPTQDNPGGSSHAVEQGPIWNITAALLRKHDGQAGGTLDQ